MSRRWKIALCIVGGGFLLFLGATLFAAAEVSRHARDWTVDWLGQHYKSQVELGAFRVSIYPHFQVNGEDLVLHFEGRSDLPPLIKVKRFVLQAHPLALLRNPRQVAMVRLEGLAINIPPRQQNASSANANLSRAIRNFRSANFAEIVSDNATLTVLTANPSRDPLSFAIEHLVLHPTGTEGELAFRATLTNPMPPGEIVSTGAFGPWIPDAPSLTPVSGTYTFNNADLGVFQGIAGVLSAQGSYSGILERIESDGTTDTPDFRVVRAGHPVDLKTTYHATVDGTDGDTYLDPVEVRFLNTILVARGKVEGIKGQPGKSITLDVTGDHARIEDVLKLTVSAPATMTGPLQLKTKFLLPHGTQNILDRLALKGSFTLPSAHFTNDSVQQRFDNFSKRSLGDPRDLTKGPDASDDVASAMGGDLDLSSGLLTLSNLAFQVPGADITLHGTYNLNQETLDLHGHLAMDAKLSQTTTGVKSFFLKAVDPFFAKNGKGTVLSIKIVGSVKQPSYGLDFHHKEAANLPPQ